MNLGVIFYNSFKCYKHVSTICDKILAMLQNLWLTKYFTQFNIRLFLAITYLIIHITYIIGHYNNSVRIIDLVSHTTYAMCESTSPKKYFLYFVLMFTLLYGNELFTCCNSVSKNKLTIPYKNIASFVYGPIRYCMISTFLYKI